MSIRIDGTNTAANPGITGADADTGLQFGTNEVKIVTGGTDRVTVDNSSATFAGNVTSGSVNLGSNDALGSQLEPGVVFSQRKSTDSNSSALFSGFKGNSEKFRVNVDGSATFAGQTIVGGNPDNGGAAGVRLWNGGAISAARTSNGQGVFSAYIVGNSTPTINLMAGGSATFAGTVTAAGRLGVNTSSPDYTVDINGELGVKEGQPVTWHDGSGNAAAQIFGDSSSNLIFRTGTSAMGERMRLNSSGYLGIGAVNRLDHGGIFFRPSVTAGAGEISFNRANTGSTSFPITFYSDGGIVGSITYTNVATSYNTSSDYRLKENVVDLDGAITRVKQLLPKRFNFIVDADTTVDGFLAHEAQTIVPEAVTGEKDGEEMQGIDQSKLVPLLTAALQEAIAKIETLETQNASLEARLTTLEGGAS